MTIEQLLEVVASLNQSDQAELITALKGEDEQWKEDAPKVFKEMLLGFRKAHGKEQQGRGSRETRTKFERLLRSGLGDIYDLPKDAKGEALISALKELVEADRDRLTQLSTKVEGKEGELTLEDLIKRDDLRDYLAEKIADGRKADQEEAMALRSKLEAIQLESANAEKRAIITRLVGELATKHNIVFDFDGDKEKGLERRNRFTKFPEFDPANFKLEGEELIPVDKEGNVRYHDVTQARLTMDDIVIGANVFPVKKYESNPTPTPEGGVMEGSYKLRDSKEYHAAIAANQGNDEELRKIHQSWLNRSSN